MLRFLILSVVALAGCSSAATFAVSNTDLANPIVTRTDTTGPHRVLISRRVDSPNAERLLRIAEATYPTRSSVLAAARGLSSADSAATDLWWNTTFDGIRQPYAITAAAVRYYAALSDEYRRNDAVGADNFLAHSSLDYRAAIEHAAMITIAGKTYFNVYVARLTLHWDARCGSLCGQDVSKARIVVLSSGGRVRAITGDEASDTIVS